MAFLTTAFLWRSTASSPQSWPLNNHSKEPGFIFSLYQHSRPLILPWIMPLTGYLSKPLGLSKCHHSSPPHKTASRSSPLLTQDQGIAASPSAFGQNRCKKPKKIWSSQTNSNFSVADAAVKEPRGYKNWDTGVFLIWPHVVTIWSVSKGQGHNVHTVSISLCLGLLSSMDIWAFLLQLWCNTDYTHQEAYEVICQRVFIHNIYAPTSRWKTGQFELAFVLILGWS